jgi:hypothetical protein
VITIYEVGYIPDEYGLNVYEYTTNGFLGLKCIVVPHHPSVEHAAITLANKLFDEKVISIPNNQFSGAIYLVY